MTVAYLKEGARIKPLSVNIQDRSGTGLELTSNICTQTHTRSTPTQAEITPPAKYLSPHQTVMPEKTKVVKQSVVGDLFLSPTQQFLPSYSGKVSQLQ